MLTSISGHGSDWTRVGSCSDPLAWSEQEPVEPVENMNLDAVFSNRGNLVLATRFQDPRERPVIQVCR